MHMQPEVDEQQNSEDPTAMLCCMLRQYARYHNTVQHDHRDLRFRTLGGA
jgi:hypothetical protein